MKHILKSLLLATAVTSLSLALSASAAEGTAPAKKEAAATKPTNFRGKIASVDPVAKSVTVTNQAGTSRTLVLTSTTKLTKAGKPAVFQDAVAGEEAGGSYRTAADGKLELATFRIGPASKTTAAPKPEKATK